MAKTKGGSVIYDDELDMELFPPDIIAKTDLIAAISSEFIDARDNLNIDCKKT